MLTLHFVSDGLQHSLFKFGSRSQKPAFFLLLLYLCQCFYYVFLLFFVSTLFLSLVAVCRYSAAAYWSLTQFILPHFCNKIITNFIIKKLLHLSAAESKNCSTTLILDLLLILKFCISCIYYLHFISNWINGFKVDNLVN